MKVSSQTRVTLRTVCPTTGLVAAVIISTAGCAGDSLSAKDYQPENVAAAAMAACDADQDGKITEEELQAFPALAAALDRIDANRDGVVDASEISARIAAYAPMSDYIVADVLIKRGTRPLPGAEVTLTLAEFMGADLASFTATTDSTGIGMPESSPAGLLGFPPGIYDVEVIHDGRTRRFGVEIADDIPFANRLKFDVQEK